MSNPEISRNVDFAQFLQPDHLQRSLEAVCAQRRLDSAAVSICAGDLSAEASVGALEPNAPTKFSTDTAVFAGCITKSVTATLAMKAVAEGLVDLHSDVAELLNEPRIRGIEFHHLLSHTHGLDGCAIERVALDERGFIDTRSLTDAVYAHAPLSSAGSFFNYGNIGPWFAGATLERLYQKPYAAILFDTLHNVAGYEADASGGDLRSAFICPATGESLKISARGLLSFVKQHLAGRLGSPDAFLHSLALMRESPVPLNYWQPKLREVGLGWNGFGDGWYGHGAMMRGDSAIIRFNADIGIGIVVTAAREEAAAVVLASIFAPVLAEFKLPLAPKYFSQEDWANIDPSCYVGAFGNGSFKLLVDIAANRSLRCRVFARHPSAAHGSDDPLVKRYLKAAEGDLFISTPHEPLIVPYANFVSRQSDGRFEFVYTGKHLLRRLPH